MDTGMLRAMTRLLAPLKRRVQLMVARGVVKLVDDSLKLQGLQLTLLAGEVADDAEHFQPYGFTSVPLPGAEAILVCVGGNRDHGVVIAVDDRRHRKTGLADGEVALYHKDGAFILLKDGGDVEITAPGAVKVDAQTVEVTAGGTAKVTAAAVELSGGLPATGIVQGDCICAFTGSPHPQTSVTIKGSL